MLTVGTVYGDHREAGMTMVWSIVRFSSRLLLMVTLCNSLAVICLADGTRDNEQTVLRGRVISAWQRYFRCIRSLEFQSLSSFPVHPVLTDSNRQQRHTFLLNGSCYRSQLKMSQEVDYPEYVIAFDGERHQTMTIARRGEVSLEIKAKPSSTLIYGSSIPLLLTMFEFCFAPGDPISVEFLQRPMTWESVRSRIISVAPFKHDNKDCILVKMKGTTVHQRYDIIASASTGYPLVCRLYEEIPFGLNKIHQLCTAWVKRTTLWKAGAQQFEFPLEIIGETKRNGKTVIVMKEEIIGSVVINKYVGGRDKFKIPHTLATVVSDRTKEE